MIDYDKSNKHVDRIWSR